ncbi:MAG: carbohydrate binding domain-containing protein [Clostridia bacterium]|nr:carbohydrate binding domain-containing protein [Clostridia bacterium]
MKYTILSFFRRIFAWFLALIASIGGGTPVKVIDRPPANTVAEYDAENADYTLDIHADDVVCDISDLLFGIFFEDINFAADGGLYAEMVANRSFEYTELAAGDGLYGWDYVGAPNLTLTADRAEYALNANNPTFLVIANSSDRLAGVKNRGFLDGMSVEAGKEYKASFYARAAGAEEYGGGVTLRLCIGDTVAAEASIPAITGEWTKYEAVLTPDATAHENVTLQVLIGRGTVDFDMISLFPADTFKGRENGLRKDLGEMLEDLQPKFLRFPGGCVIEGVDYETAYHWKDSIGTGPDGLPLEFGGGYGDVAARKQGVNLWTDLAATEDPLPCFMSYGLGFYEFFLLCEDIGASPVPVLNCGLYCQMRGKGGVDMESDEFAGWLQDMHDLVEFARGGADTTWGKVRASLGHPEPFDLHYICIGNENEREDYYERYAAFLESFCAAKAEKPALYDGLELIYSAGPSDATHGTNYIRSYEFAEQYIKENILADALDFAGAIDQHYYNDPSWFLKNTDYYDRGVYGRTTEEITATRYGGAIPVFLGEYAARSNRLEAALAEAAFMTGLERNGDIVRMAAYAPLFGNLTATHWSPDLIWFNNAQTTGSINYYVQKLFMNHQGARLLNSELSGAAVPQADIVGKVGVGTWYTSAAFDNVKVVRNSDGKTLDKDDFTLPGFRLGGWTTPTDGKFRVKGGELVQSSTDMAYSETGSVAYFGDDQWTDYTYTVDARKLDGEEGFLIPFGVKDTGNNIFWNIGGWQNTVSCLQIVENGGKTGQIPGTVRDFTAETGRIYALKVVVSGRNIKCYIDDELYVDHTVGSNTEAESYQVVSEAENGDIVIKLVNVTGSDRTFAVKLSSDGAPAETARVYQLKGDSLDNDNVLGQPEACKIEEFDLDGISDAFNYTAPKYSVTVLRISKS